MSARTGIQWTDATFNPWWGCTKVSPGCDHCYAEGVSKRFAPNVWGADGERRVFSEHHWAEPRHWDARALRERRRIRVFTGSMCDVFEDHETAHGYRPNLFGLIESTPNLDWQILTKRIGNAKRMVPPRWLDGFWPRNAWIGATVVNQQEANRDIPKLIRLPARFRFLSCEPLLGPILFAEGSLSFTRSHGHRECWGHEEILEGFHGVDWVICGGESGNHARPMNPAWAQSLRDQCAASRVPFFFKQWGEWMPNSQSYWLGPVFAEKDWPETFNRFDGFDAVRIGKTRAGRLLDGYEYSEFPE
jgi:protein gp37